MNIFGRSSVRWRIALMYFTLFFVVMSLVSVYLVNSIEQYQISALKENIFNTISESNLLQSLGAYDSLSLHGEEIQGILNASWSSFSEELSVVDEDFRICASTNSNLSGYSAADIFDPTIIASCLMDGEPAESDSVISGEIHVKNLCYKIENGTNPGVIYIRADLSNINSFVAQSKLIFIQAMVIALLITVVLGFMLAKSITGPINEVTRTVEKMSTGDFSEGVDVQSDDEIGKLAGMFNMLRERLDSTITEISKEKNKLSTILNYMGDGLVAIDLGGKIIHANPVARNILKIPASRELEGSDYDEVMGHISENIALERIKANCEKEGVEGMFSMGDSTYAVRYDRFKDETGNDIGIIILMQDITERQKLEEMQRDFVANVSHELRTPLTNIKSYAETLMDGAVEDRETAESFLDIINNEADRMARLVKDLLQLSRLERRSEKMEFRERNIVQLVKECIKKVDISAKRKNQQLNSLFDLKEDIRVMLDKDRMEQVVLNILSNAIKYTQEGGRIDIDIKASAAEVTVAVEDNGIGIPEQDLARVFDRFYRVDKARSRSMGGTGLGLAISKQIVEEHMGTIRAEKARSRGTRFVLTLPRSVHKGVPNIE